MFERVVCVPHYLGQVAQGSRSICFQGTTFRNVRLNADRLHDIVAYPRCRVFPCALSAGVRAGDLSYDGLLLSVVCQIMFNRDYAIRRL